MKAASTHVTARWDREKELYLCDSLGCWSEDGTEWRDNSGKLMDGDEFDDATIRLEGGPLDGVDVS